MTLNTCLLDSCVASFEFYLFSYIVYSLTGLFFSMLNFLSSLPTLAFALCKLAKTSILSLRKLLLYPIGFQPTLHRLEEWIHKLTLVNCWSSFLRDTWPFTSSSHTLTRSPHHSLLTILVVQVLHWYIWFIQCWFGNWVSNRDLVNSSMYSLVFNTTVEDAVFPPLHIFVLLT